MATDEEPEIPRLGAEPPTDDEGPTDDEAPADDKVSATADSASDDEVWADLVARIRTTGPDDPRTIVWPASEDADESWPDVLPDVLPDVPADVDADPGTDDGDHFVPPPPPPAPRLSRVGRWGVASVALGLFLLVAPGVVGLRRTTALSTIAVALVVGGALALLSRVRSGPSQDDGWDDGAVL